MFWKNQTTSRLLVVAALGLSFSGCGGGGSSADVSGPITISTAVSRTTGVAPLSVFFDATATTAAATTRPFHDLEYRWEFGDPTSGAWGQGVNPAASSKNLALGGVAAHVFETPGTYTVRLTVTDGTHSSSTTTTITVTDPDVVFAASTTCISTDGDFTGAPAGSVHVTDSNLTTAMANAIAAGAKRILFKRGQVFTTSASRTSLPVDGPSLIGAFGAGARPIFRSTAGGAALLCADSQHGFVTNDCRIMDIELDGGSFTAPSTSTGIQINGNHNTVLRVHAHDMGEMFSVSGNNAAVVDCTTLNVVGANGNMPMYAQDVFGFFVAGCLLDGGYNNHGEYDLRYQGGKNGIISHNTMVHCGNSKEVFTLRGDYTQKTYVTQYHVISDNILSSVDSPGTLFVAGINPQNSSRNELIRDVVFERNHMISGADGFIMMTLACSDITLRNNLLDNSLSGGPMIVVSYGGNTGGLPALVNNHLYNNTFFSSSSKGVTAIGVRLEGSALSGTEIINNFLYAPNAKNSGFLNDVGADMIDGSSSTADPTLIAHHNSTNAQARTAAPTLTAVPPLTWTDWRLDSGCYAVGAGAAVPIWSDFFLAPLGPTTPRDLGAIGR